MSYNTTFRRICNEKLSFLQELYHLSVSEYDHDMFITIAYSNECVIIKFTFDLPDLCVYATYGTISNDNHNVIDADKLNSLDSLIISRRLDISFPSPPTFWRFGVTKYLERCMSIYADALQHECSDIILDNSRP